MGKIYIGTSGYNYKDWKERFYPPGMPQKEWLLYYSQQFSTLEINATFYRNFEPHVYKKWYLTTPGDFVFAIKGPRTVTHIKRLNKVEDELEDFFAANAQLRHKLGCILWQFPSNFKNDSGEKLSTFLQFISSLPRSIRQVIEFRHGSWFSDDIYEFMKEANIGFVISDTSKFPTRNVVTSDYVYIRFHGPDALYASSYSDDALQQWANKIMEWQRDTDVYAYFNNDINGHAVENARVLIEFLSASGAALKSEL
jgi:uncharacterized protein YecE (DUF72 family)